MQNRKRDTDVKNSPLDSVGEGKGGMIWEGSIETCILSYVKWTVGPGLMHETRAGTLGRPRGMGWGGRQENTCKSMANSCQCMAKITTIL